MKKEIRDINLNAITPDPTQPRKDFDQEELEELAQSIRQNGLLNPITVKENKQKNVSGSGGQYIIIAGERRYQAHQILDEETIECIVFNGKNGRELQLVENINRKDLNSMEVVGAYRLYLDDGHTIEELAQVVGKPKNIISWLLNLEKCRPDIQHLVKTGGISIVTGIALSKLSLNGQAKAIGILVANKLSVSEAQKLTEQIYATEVQATAIEDDVGTETLQFTKQVEGNFKSACLTAGPKLTAEHIKAKSKLELALQKACQALMEIEEMEIYNPGMLTEAHMTNLEATKEKLDLLTKCISKIRHSLEWQKVGHLC